MIKLNRVMVLSDEQIVDQESLETLQEIDSPAVFCIAAWFGNVRLIDNIEISNVVKLG